MFKNILFDLDGTLGNTLPLCILAFRTAIEPLAGRSLSDAEVIATFGPSEEGTIKAFVPLHFEEGLRRYLDAYAKLHSGWPAPFEGILEMLSFLKRRGAFIALVTGKGLGSAQVTLERYGLERYFDAVKTGSPSGPVKDICIEEIIASYSLNRDETLYVGDSPGDIAASRTCRIQVAAAAWAPTSDPDELRSCRPDYLFTSVSDFYAMLCNETGSAEKPKIGTI